MTFAGNGRGEPDEASSEERFRSETEHLRAEVARLRGELSVAKEEAAAALSRVEELQKANIALASATTKLRETNDIKKSLGSLLSVMLEQLGSGSGSIWLWQHDGTSDLLEEVVDGQALGSQSSHPGSRAYTVGDNGAAAAAKDRQQFGFEISIYDVETAPEYDHRPDVRNYLLSLGVKQQLLVPIVSSGIGLGCFVIRSKTVDSWSQEQIELAQALANQAALALELNRLAEEAKQAAVANERADAATRRAEALAKANDAVRECLAELAAGGELRDFLARVLAAAVSRLKAAGGGVWLYDEKEERATLRIQHDGEHVVDAVASDHPGSKSFFNSRSDWKQTVLEASKISLDTVEDYEKAGGPYLPYAKYFREQGIAAVACVPMFVGATYIGVMSLRFSGARDQLSAEEEELAHALSNQAALAVHLNRLSDAARNAAVAREKEAAAQARADKLALANQALRGALESLHQQGDLRSFLGSTLKAISEQLGAHSAAIWRTDLVAREARLLFVVEDGQVVAAEHSTHPNARLPHRPSEDDWLQGPMIGNETARPQVNPRQGNTGLTPEQRDYLLSLGVNSLLSVPMVLDGRNLGFFTVRLRQQVPPQEDLELVQALANHATLALRLSELAEQAKDAAVARERAEAATRRAETLAQANMVIRDCLAALATGLDLNQFLAQVLKAAVERLGAAGGGAWLFSEDTFTAKMVLNHDGTAVAEASDHPGRRPIGLADWSRRTEYMLDNKLQYLSQDDYVGKSSTDDVAVLDFMRRNNVRTIACVPMFVGSSYLGSLTLRYPQSRLFSPSEEELAYALANQAALAVHTSRLADEAKQAAVAQERAEAATRRAEALARANAAVRDCLSALATGLDLEAFLGRVLQSVVRQFDAQGGGVWFCETGPGGEPLYSLVLNCEGGVVEAAADTAHPGRGWSQDPRNHDASRRHLDNKIIYLGLDHMADALRTHLEQQGVQQVVSIPMFVGSEYLGALTLRFGTSRSLAPEEEELAYALANQAALAVHTTRLATQAQQAAIALERQAAAEERALKLSRANIALQRASERLQTSEDIAGLLGHTLLSIAEQVGSTSATVWLVDLKAEKCYLKWVIEDGHLIEASLSAHPNARAPAPFRSDVARRLYTSTLPVYSDLTVEEALTDDQKVYLAELKVRWLLTVPMVLGGEQVGFFTLRVRDGEERLGQEDLELIQALANQATLSLRVSALAEEARNVAVAKERERVAKRHAASLQATSETVQQSLDMLATGAGLDAFLKHVLTTVTARLDVPVATLWLYDPDTDRNMLRMVCEDGVVSNIVPHDDMPANGLPCEVWEPWSQMRETKEPVYFADPQNDPRLGFVKEWMTREGVRSLLIVPLILGSKMLGTFGVHRLVPGPWNEDEVGLLRSLGHQATLAVQMTLLSNEAKSAAVLEERARLAREVHDGIAQAFIGIGMELQKVEEGSATEALKKAVQLSEHGLAEARRAIKALRPVQLSKKTFTEAVKAMAVGILGDRIRLSVAASGDWPQLGGEREPQLFRIVQEAVNNAAKHSEADLLMIDISARTDEVSILVSDDGKGFVVSTAAAAEDRFGMFTMKQRAASIGATLKVLSQPGEGTQVFVSLPLTSNALN